jgi:putative ABC transport system substrate-binding protein
MTGATSIQSGTSRRLFAFVCLVIVILALLGVRAIAAGPVTAVLFPDIREPFRGVFLSITKGIEDAGLVVRLHPIEDDESDESIRLWVQRSGVQSVIALGSRGQSLSDELSPYVPVVMGAVHISPQLQDKRYYGIALSPQPRLLLQRLKALAPNVNRVTLIYHKQRDYWMVEHARQPAQALGITLNPIPVERLQEAVVAYQRILATLRSDVDALWLSQDSAVLDEQAVLPMILQQAWDHRLIVFSSNPAHVKRGTLFAMYPDNERMGKSLGNLALHDHDRANRGPYGTSSGLALLEDLSTAFNVRTAGHIGVHYSKESLSEYDLVFPTM